MGGGEGGPAGSDARRAGDEPIEGRPRLSIVVPTRNRPDLAVACVRALLAQDHPSFEVVLCDQSEGDATARALSAAGLESVGGQPPLAQGQRRLSPTAQGQGGPSPTSRFRRVAVPGRGRSRALNAGLPHALGEVVVLTDDDCTPNPGWLACLEAATHEAGPRALVLGRVLPGPVAPGMGIPPATLEDPAPADYAGPIDRDLVYPNVAVPRAAFAELGGFDERMSVGTPLPGGEDNDFGYRLLCAGFRIAYRPGPGVVHHAWRSVAQRAALKRDYGIGQGAFYAKHLARADLWIGRRLVRDVLRTSRAAAGAAVRGCPEEALGHLRFLTGMLVGLCRMGVLLARRVPSGEDAVRRALRGGGSPAPAATSASLERAR